MNKPELIAALIDMRESYHAAVDLRTNGKSEEGSAALIEADKALLSLVDAARDGHLTMKEPTPPIEGKTIGARLKCLRVRRGTTQHEILKILDRPKSSQSWYSLVETDEKKMPIADLKTLACFYGVSLDELVP
jgi:hypothetical protein